MSGQGYWQRTEDTSRLFSVDPPVPPQQVAQVETSLGTRVLGWLKSPAGQICAWTAAGAVCYIAGGIGGKTRRNRGKRSSKTRRA